MRRCPAGARPGWCMDFPRLASSGLFHPRGNAHRFRPAVFPGGAVALHQPEIELALRLFLPGIAAANGEFRAQPRLHELIDMAILLVDRARGAYIQVQFFLEQRVLHRAGRDEIAAAGGHLLGTIDMENVEVHHVAPRAECQCRRHAQKDEAISDLPRSGAEDRQDQGERVERDLARAEPCSTASRC